MFENLEIKVYLASPVVFGRFPLHLDSLIYWSLDCFINNTKSTIEAMGSVLKCTDDVFHASQAIPCGEYEKITLGRTRNNNLFNHLNAPVKMPEKPVKMNPNTISICSAFQIRAIKFYCVGQKDLILNLMNQLNGIGCFASSGFGQIKNIEATVIDEDCSFALNGNLNRVLPLSFITKNQLHISIDQPSIRARYKPPYINSKTENCLIPFTELRSK